MDKEHLYTLTITWTGNTGTGTSGYRMYERSHRISAIDKPEILASSDPAFRGDKQKYNPEELLVASLSSCHMLWFLHLCADQGIIVTDYVDNPSGKMVETAGGGGRFTEVTLHPIVTISTPGSLYQLDELHNRAHQLCFIANSVNFPVKHLPQAKTN
ncbi:OsmC family peroxiredoxin [Rhodocytophaga rosea]|uniref:OsmC family peroxiredoxin n=1 Tax=Rhodocytophaga rosea TaxID=2704465 RepID=A0A6C0GSE9_9BACT|nr:OsmC family protein [Rhodocytophaga rosea]QHT71045.1 OsmC family peroxiredoxin [Rhodocytophaga rosea]